MSARAAEHTSTPLDTRSVTGHWVRALLVALVAVVAAHLLDQYAWAHWRDPRVNDRDWGRFLRSLGYLPTWIVVAIGFWTHDRSPAARATHTHTHRGPLATFLRSRGSLVLGAAMLGGLLAELLKLVVRRLRPDPDTFGYVFRAFSDDPLSTRGLGMPSSHVIVAFAGAAALARLLPRAAWLWYLLAAGCAATRVLALGHFLSDVVTAAALGWFTVLVLDRQRKTPEA